MKCLRSGYCCKKLFSVVVDNPEKGISEGNLITNNGTRCKHLVGNEPGKYSCAIHHYDWFHLTPCADYNSHGGNRECLVGKFTIKQHLKKLESNKNIVSFAKTLFSEEHKDADE